MSGSFRLACVQVNAQNQLENNIAAASYLIRKAADCGADLISLPECVAMIEPDRRALLLKTPDEQNHPALSAFSELASEYRCWLHVGSIAVKHDGGKIANRSFLIDQSGVIVSTYDKIHMFDVDLGNGESYRESDTYQPGDSVKIASLPWGQLGLTICYDLRFPDLYIRLAKNGADFLAVPSAFTWTTGRAHWHVLLRARAIETGCWVFAAAQCGDHGKGRQTFGHSLIVDPWGKIVAEAGDEPGVISADIDPGRVGEARAAIPTLKSMSYLSSSS
jgi:predicted amidohydrolase